MRSGAYSYRKFWKYPGKLYQFGRGEKKLVISKGIEYRQITVAGILFLFLFMMRGWINQFLPSTLQLAFYGLLPWFIAGQLCRSKLDGKRLDRFFLQYFKYLLFGRTQYSNGKAVYARQMKKPQTYEKLR